MHLYEEEIQTCGWKGGIPYWDWILDANDFINSPIFDTKSGFGGNGDYIPGNFTHPEPGFPVNTPWDVVGRSGGGCIQDGPFENLQTNLGPQNGTALNPHCVTRDFSAFSFRNMSGPAAVEEGMGQLDYGWFDRISESTFHSGGHWGVGGLYGTMTDMWASREFPQSPSLLDEKGKLVLILNYSCRPRLLRPPRKPRPRVVVLADEGPRGAGEGYLGAD